MNIRYIVLLAVFVFMFFQYKQSNSDLGSLEKTLDTYKELELSMKYEDMVDLIYPKVYNKKFTKEQMYTNMQKRSQRVKSKSKILDFTLVPRLPLKTYAEGLYTIADYTKKMQIDFSSKLPKNADLEAIKKFKRKVKSSIALIRLTLKKGDLIELDEMSNVATLTKHGAFILINEKENGWKIIDTVLPKKLLKSILHRDIINEEQEFITQLKDSIFSGKM